MLTVLRERAVPGFSYYSLSLSSSSLPPFYNFKAPEFIGIPFFYWFQLLWIVITAILMAIVYWLKV